MTTNKGQLRSKILEFKRKGLSHAAIATKLNEEGYKSTRGTKINASLVGYVVGTSKKRTNTTNSFNINWIKKVLTEKTLQDGEKIRVLQATLDL